MILCYFLRIYYYYEERRWYIEGILHWIRGSRLVLWWGLLRDRFDSSIPRWRESVHRSYQSEKTFRREEVLPDAVFPDQGVRIRRNSSGYFGRFRQRTDKLTRQLITVRRKVVRGNAFLFNIFFVNILLLWGDVNWKNYI